MTPVVQTLQRQLATEFSSPLLLNDLADELGVSLRTLQRRFSLVTGLTPKQYQQKLRLQKACELLEGTKMPFDSIAFQVGYQDVSAFRKLFKREVGLLPKAFRERFCR